MKFNLKHYPNIQSPGLLQRDVWVWPPPQYDQNRQAHFPVIYMHDGQNLFIKDKSYTKVTWGVAEAITKLSAFGFIQSAIVVGIDNTDNRHGDYLPTKPFESPEGKAYIAELSQKNPEALEEFDYVADEYLKLIVEKIKPQIDADFRTLSDTKNTIIMGSSMGSLISLYALLEYPDVFGGAGCLSTHWPAFQHLVFPYLRKNLPDAGVHRIYFDHGTRELDTDYAPYQRAVNDIMQEKGYIHGRDWLTRVAPGAGHHESAWRSRLHVALRLLLGVQVQH